MKQAVFSPEATQDVLDIEATIAADNPDAAERFVADLERACQLLADMPGTGAPRDWLLPTLRMHPVGSYPIFCAPNAQRGSIEILRVLHRARDIGSDDFLII